MMIEDKSTYAYQLRHLANPSFDKIRNLAKDFIMKLSEQLKDELYEEIERGEKQLETEPELMYYLHAFGKMHKAKLNYAFEHLPETFFEIPEINIIDYGCGQAVATMCYADFLRKQGYKQKIRRVTLIEPSEAALKRAALHVSVFFPDAEIVTINKGFDDLKTKDIVCDEDVPTLHLLSNVLDMECFSLAAFMRLLNKTIGSSNMFVCVGPYFGEESDRSKRMDWFNENLMDDGYFVDDLDAGEFDENNSWTCMVRCFGVGDLDYSVSDEKLSTVAKAGDLWIQDKYGVVYSKDGKRLLNAHYCDFETYTIKNGIKVICGNAFLRSPLRSIVIPDSVTSIGDRAFEDCKSLQSIVIPKSVISIGVNPFVNSGIKSIVSHSKFFKADGKALYDQKKKLLIAFYSNCSHFVIPSSVTSIGNWAFYGCTALQYISIPNSVTNIGGRAFLYCESLQSIVIPNSVTNIGYEAFSSCHSLQSIFIPNSVTSIGEDAFKGCKSLQSIVIPNSVSSIGNSAFSFCTSLQSIVIPDSVTDIGDSMFRDCGSLRSINIPNSVKSIGYGAFMLCDSLQSIIIPNSVKSIGDNAFRYCESLQSIVIPDSVTSIGNSAFSGCDSLRTILIPKGSRKKFEKLLPDYKNKLVER